MNINIMKTLMEKENISMYRLSKLSGIENKSIWNIVNNKRKDPQISTVVKIAKALDLNEHEFAELCDYKVNKQSCIPLEIKDENDTHYGGNPLLGEWITGTCPKCKKDVQLGMNYCSNCGQRLLWNEEE
ncbi:helix-turn-helix transcriptional regulator [Faecalibacillus intestinalis]|uniref:helix-turn-helix domain-containing protein n=1 Tax=Faecalibacillus intestinalis TaxID=1982626 RepID=UPI00295E7121|nr:helix-turn-helix transcriptional regulator [Faecalibacillus intestinalis]